MNFAAIIQRRQRASITRFSPDAAGRKLRVYFPAARSVKSTEFPDAVDCQEGSTPTKNQDLTGLLNRRSRTTTISILTADLPAIFRRDSRDTIPARQTVRLGYTSQTAEAYEVATSTSHSGITQIELELVS